MRVITGAVSLFLKKQIKKIPCGILFASVLIVCGCSSLHAYAIVLTTPYDGKVVLEKEEDVRHALEGILLNAEEYTMKAYFRTAISYKVKRTEDTTHSFYVISREGEPFRTLSFSATGKWATSEGAWAMNTDSDISSYEDYLRHENRWGVEEIEIANGINTRATISGVLEKIRSDVTYYFRSEVNDGDETDSCNTALMETLAGN